MILNYDYVDEESSMEFILIHHLIGAFGVVHFMNVFETTSTTRARLKDVPVQIQNKLSWGKYFQHKMNEFCLIYGTNIVKTLQNAEMMFVFIFQIDRKNAWYFFMKGCMVWLYLAFFRLAIENCT